MKMNDYINDFTNHLKDAIKIAYGTKLKKSKKAIKNVLICGLGGSGIGGTIVSDLISKKISIPVITNKDYTIPSFVNKHTLVIVSSYSGNTEETLSALEKCQAKESEIAIITSGGRLNDIGEKNGYNRLIVPKGHPPRAMFAYAFAKLFYMLHHYKIIDGYFEEELENSINLLEEKKSTIQKQALSLAKKLYGKTPVIYTPNGFEGVGVRFRQQINENSKMLCWHHVIPEMNHNELLGWRVNTSDLAVVCLRNKSDYQRTQVRMNITKKVISKFTKNISEIWSEGDTLIENSLYHINLGDWVSWYLSEMNQVDAIEIDVINFLKKELSKL
tara:strand:- start:5658 stop:6647 length:990 start_codon:yes stop_codon:yes gene_type:complete